MVVGYAKDELHAEHVYNYSVSFGSYLTLLYIQRVGNPFTRIALRSSGIGMYQLMLNNVDPNDIPKLERGKEVEVGFERKMKIDQKFLHDLKDGDVTKLEYFDWADDMIMLHGTEDEYVPYEQAQEFADNNVIEFTLVEGADHPFRNPKYMDLAIHTVVEFFAGKA